MERKTRLDWIDYTRGIAILLVVYRHVFEGLKNTGNLKTAGVDFNDYLYLEQANIFLFSFRMPLFFIVSGIFLGMSLSKRGLVPLVENKAKTILYPYFIWGILQISIQIAFAAFINSKKSIADLAYLLYAPREVEQFWYLYALFNVTILFAFLKARLNLTTTQQLGFGLLLFLLSALFSQYSVEWGFISDIFHYYIFMAIGEAISKLILGGALHRFFYSWKAFFGLLPLFLLSQYYFLTTNIEFKTLSPKYLYVEYYQPFVFLCIALMGCAFVVSVACLLERYSVAKWLSRLGKHSLYIYVLHVIAFATVRVIMIYIFHVYNVHVLLLICIAGGVIIPVIVYKISKKLGWQFLFTIEQKRQPATKEMTVVPQKVLS